MPSLSWRFLKAAGPGNVTRSIDRVWKAKGCTQTSTCDSVWRDSRSEQICQSSQRERTGLKKGEKGREAG